VPIAPTTSKAANTNGTFDNTASLCLAGDARRRTLRRQRLLPSHYQQPSAHDASKRRCAPPRNSGGPQPESRGEPGFASLPSSRTLVSAPWRARKPRRLRTDLMRVASGLLSPAMAYLASSPPAGGRPALYEKGRISATNYGEKVLLFLVRRKTTWDYSKCHKRRRQARRARFAPRTRPSGLAP